MGKIIGRTVALMALALGLARTEPVNAESYLEKVNANDPKIKSELNMRAEREDFYNGYRADNTDKNTECTVKLPVTITKQGPVKLEFKFTPALRYSENLPAHKNERFIPGEITSDLDEISMRASVEDTNGNETSLGVGKFDYPFRINGISWDHRICPEGAYASQILHNNFGEATFTTGYFREHDINNNPYSEQVRGEISLEKRFGEFSIEFGGALTDSFKSGTPNKRIMNPEVKYSDLGGTIKWNPKTLWLKEAWMSGDFSHNLEKEDSAAYLGIGGRFARGLKTEILLFDKDLTPYTPDTGNGNIGSKICKGYMLRTSVSVPQLLKVKWPFDLTIGMNKLFGQFPKGSVPEEKGRVDLFAEVNFKFN